MSEKYMETCFSINVADGSPELESYMETRLYSRRLHSAIDEKSGCLISA